MRLVAERVMPNAVAWQAGWDAVMWKFWHLADELSKEKNKAELPAVPATLKQMLVSKKFIKRSNQYMIGAGGADESIINLIFLLTWINRIQLTGKKHDS